MAPRWIRVSRPWRLTTDAVVVGSTEGPLVLEGAAAAAWLALEEPLSPDDGRAERLDDLVIEALDMLVDAGLVRRER